MKITVLTATYRQGNLLQLQSDALSKQTFDDFEWVIVDDWHNNRKFKPDTEFPTKWLPPRGGTKPYFAAASAWNTGFIVAEGELVYLMNDYIIMNDPTVLQRHWDLYQQYGPKVIISGPIDGTRGSGPIEKREGPLSLGDDVTELTDYEYVRRWYWAGRNDSMPLAEAIAVNGFAECLDGDYGGQDVEIAVRMMNNGCRYIIDRRVPVFELEHEPGKVRPGSKVHWETLIREQHESNSTWVDNGWSIADERVAH